MGAMRSPKLPHSSPNMATPPGSPPSSRSGSAEQGKVDGMGACSSGTPTILAPNNPTNSPTSGDNPGLDGAETKSFLSDSRGSKQDGLNKDHAEPEEEEVEEPMADEAYKLQVKNSGRTNEELRSLIEAFSPEQLRRYEVFRRSSLNKSNTRVLLSSILSQQVTQNLAMIVAGFSKVFVGEIVELALDVKREWDEAALAPHSTGNSAEVPKGPTPLQPQHLREAYRRYCKQSNLLAGPRGPVAPATATFQNGVPTTLSRPPRFFRR